MTPPVFEMGRTCEKCRETWRRIFQENFPPYPGGVLAFFGGTRTLTDFALAYDLTIRCLGDAKAEQPIYRQFIHVWPSALRGRNIPDEYRAATERCAKEDGVGPQATEEYLSTVCFHAVSTCDGRELLSALAETPPHSSVYVHRAEMYRFPDVRTEPRASSRSIDGHWLNLNLADDAPSNHAEHLIQEVLKIAGQKQIVVALSFESYGFANTGIPESLKNQKHLAVMNAGVPDSHACLRSALLRCLDGASEIPTDEALAIIRDAGGSAINTAVFSAGALFARGLHGLAWQTIDSVKAEILSSGICSQLLFATQAALAVGRHDEVSLFLDRATEVAPEEFDLLVTLQSLAERIRGMDGARSVLDRLSALFPNDRRVKGVRLRYALSARDFDAARVLASDLNDAYVARLCEVLRADVLPIGAFVRDARRLGCEERARKDLAREERRRGCDDKAWRLVRSCALSEGMVQLQCDILLRCIVRRGSPADADVAGLERILEYVALHPNELDARFAVERIVNDEMEQTSSMLLLAVILDRAVSRLHALALSAPATNECGWIRDPAFRGESNGESPEALEELIETLPQGHALFLGEGHLPNALQSRATHKMLFDWIYALQNGEIWAGDSAYQTRMLVVHAIMLLAKHLNDPTSDALAMRYCVMAQSLAGRSQAARDWGETALMVLPASQPDLRAWRLGMAWLCYAEGFARSNNPLDALLNIVLCVLAIGRTAIPSMKGIKEVFRFCSRVTRDLYLLPLAMRYIQFERDVIRMHGVDTDMEYQIVHIEHSIRCLAAMSGGTVEQMQALVSEGCSFLEAEYDQSFAPMLSNMAGLFSGIRAKGGTVAPAHMAVFQKYLGQTTGALHAVLSAQVETRPTEKTLRDLAKVVGTANSLHDLSHQGRPLRMAAERAIAHAFETRDAGLFLVAASVLTQPMLSMGLNREEAEGLDPNAACRWMYEHVAGKAVPQDVVKEVVAMTAKHVSENRASLDMALEVSCDKVMSVLGEGETMTILARDGLGSLYALPFARHGMGEIRSLSPGLWAPEKYRVWRRRLPDEYGRWCPQRDPFEPERPTPSEVGESLNGLSVDGWDRTAHNMIVLDYGLFGFPLNLVPCGDGFVGQHHHVSSVPSVAWLTSVRGKTIERDGRTAWMGVPGKRDTGLELLWDKFEPAFGEFGVDVSKTDRPPAASGVQLSIVVAHGGLGTSGQFGCITADGRIHFTPREFASSFRRCGCVVLVVCNAGRSAEKHDAGETRSLVTELFENEVSAVIAPVWPLVFDVAMIWLPEFLRRFTGGDAVIDASFAASRAVEARFPNPCAWAAMHVYGDGAFRGTSA